MMFLSQMSSPLPIGLHADKATDSKKNYFNDAIQNRYNNKQITADNI